MKIKSAVFVTSAPDMAHAPPAGERPEIAVVGRSNVGKSSFLSSVVGKKGLAKTSSTPGKTRMLNYFLIDERWYLVDLPGYGFAKVSRAEQERWKRAMEQYLKQREGLTLVVQLIDARHGPQPNDMQMFQWLLENRERPLVVLTKGDKLSKAQMQRSREATAEKLRMQVEDVLPYSAETGDGREEVLRRLAPHVTG